jgi:hypothetical protein
MTTKSLLNYMRIYETSQDGFSALKLVKHFEKRQSIQHMSSLITKIINNFVSIVSEFIVLDA